jgi:hypothetical protein
MSTNARIGREIEAGNSVESIYTHWDGYPDHHGQVLLDHYAERAKVAELIALGDLSSLAAEIGEAHDFDTRHVEHGEWCYAYGRDGGEADCEPVIHGHDAWPDGGQEYEYLFTMRGEWRYREAKYERLDDGGFVQKWGKWHDLTPSCWVAEELLVSEPGASG